MKNECKTQVAVRAVATALIGGGGCIFIYSGSTRLVSFEIKLISKEVSRESRKIKNIFKDHKTVRNSESVVARSIAIQFIVALAGD